MQNQNVTMTGSAVQVKATCQSESFEFYHTAAAAHSFTFQYANRDDEVPPAQPSEVSKVGAAVGDAAGAEQYSATLFRFVAYAGKGKPWKAGETVGYLVGTGADVIVMRPRRAGGN